MILSVIPEPQRFELKSDETVFTFSSRTNITVCDGFEKAGEDLSAFMQKVFDILPCNEIGESVIFEKDSSIKKEGYRLYVSPGFVHIFSSEPSGAFYAVQTLKQLLLQNERELPELLIEDQPRLPIRSFMLDVSRYFYTVEAIELFLDAMALHKLNTFHWHLTDDQGWRIELYNHMLLCEIGGFRAYTNFGRTAHGGFYTKSEIKHIISYAHDRFITVIPEIDSPGHTVSAIAAYPFLSCFDREIPVATHTGVKHDVLCIGKESTFDFMFSVFDEVCEMFPDKIIHIGGDEIPTSRWEICPHCQKRMKDEGFTHEHELHSYYVGRIAEYLQKKGFKVIMWANSEAEERADKNIIFQCWSSDLMSDEKIAASIGGGRKMINSDSKAYYLDLPYAMINLKTAYEYEPQYIQNSDSGLLGIEACLWSEYVPSMKKAGYCTFPRLGAFSESAWTDRKNKDYSKFVQKMPSYYKLLKTIPFEPAKMKQAMPKLLRKYGYLLYFERRKLHWEGVKILIENKKLKKQVLKK